MHMNRHSAALREALEFIPVLPGLQPTSGAPIVRIGWNPAGIASIEIESWLPWSSGPWMRMKAHL